MAEYALDTSLLETLFNQVSHSTRATFGEPFFHQCVQEIAKTLGGTCGVRIGQFSTDNLKSIRLLAFHQNGSEHSPLFYPFLNAPCADIRKGKTLLCPKGVQNKFPQDDFFQTYCIESYVGIPIFNSMQNVMGEFCIFDCQPMSQDRCNTLAFFLRMLSSRTSFEMERIQIEHNFQVTRDRLDLAVEGSSDGLWEATVPKDHPWMGPETQIWFSPRFKNLLGFEDWEFDNSIPLFFDHVHIEDRQRVVDAINRHLYEKFPYDVEYRLRIKDGNYRWFNARGRAIWDKDGVPVKFAGSLRDITTTRQAQEAYRLSEEKFRQFADNIKQVFWMTDPTTLEILFISKAFEGIWEQTCESLYASPRSFLDPIHPEDKPKALDYLHRQILGPGSVEYRLVMANGRTKWIHDRSFPIINDEGKVFRVCGIAEDITLRRNLEEQLLLSEKMQAIGTLAGGLAHDFNNMLAGILGNNDLIRLFHASHPETLELVESIERSAKRATNLTQQMLDFARSGKHQDVPFDLHSIIQEVTSLTKTSNVKNIDIILELRAKRSVISGDPNQVQQLIYNLFLNALDAIEENGVISIETKTVRLKKNTKYRGSRFHAGKYICFTIGDTGCGIPQQNQKRIFEPFFTTKDRTRGTGMGLSTAYAIAKSHGGFIKVLSEENKGSTFFVYFPITDKPVRTTSILSNGQNTIRGSGCILLIDDEELVRQTAKRILESLGYKVETAKNAEEGIKIYRQKSRHFDLVVVDWIMPRMDGKACFQQLRKINPKIKAIITTGLDPLSRKSEFMRLGFMGLIPKPFDIPGLSQTLSQALSQKPNPKTT